MPNIFKARPLLIGRARIHLGKMHGPLIITKIHILNGAPVMLCYSIVTPRGVKIITSTHCTAYGFTAISPVREGKAKSIASPLCH